MSIDNPNNAAQQYINTLSEQVAQRVFGLDQVIRTLAMTRIAGGHALLQGPPGIGKTLLARSFAEAIGGSFRRIQGTPDLMPADVTGISVFDSTKAAFEFRRGPVFSDVVLVDEINRAGPKTQSALLEAMEERHVTVDGSTYPLPDSFLVIATQNPLDFEGTYPLPESQVDRFLVRLDLQYTDRESEVAVLQEYGRVRGAHDGSLESLANEATALADARLAVDAVLVERALIEYVLDLCEATRRSQDIDLGLSTRAARALLLMARVQACAAGFGFVRPDDVQGVIGAVASHRLTLAPEITFTGKSAAEVMREVVAQVPVPRVEAAATAAEESSDDAAPTP